MLRYFVNRRPGVDLSHIQFAVQLAVRRQNRRNAPNKWSPGFTTATLTRLLQLCRRRRRRRRRRTWRTSVPRTGRRIGHVGSDRHRSTENSVQKRSSHWPANCRRRPSIASATWVDPFVVFRFQRESENWFDNRIGHVSYIIIILLFMLPYLWWIKIHI